MASKKRRGGPAKGYKLTKPRKPITQHPDTQMVPDSIRGNAQRGAWKRGYLAAESGRTKRSNPYDVSKPTYERGLHRHWNLGFDAYSSRS